MKSVLSIHLDQKGAEIKNKAISRKPVELQILIVKTANSPELLDRFLRNVTKVIKSSKTSSKVVIGVLDDSRQQSALTENLSLIKDMSKEGDRINIEYLSICTEDSYNLVSKMVDFLEESKASSKINPLLFLLTEITSKSYPHDEDKRTTNKLAGGGPIATTNIAFLFGAYIAGKYKYDLESVCITHNDDDIIYKTSDINEAGLPVLVPYDYFQLRENLLKNKLITMSKYIGTKGSPISVIESTLHVVLGILENLRTSVHSNAVSPYPIFDETNYRYFSYSVSEIKNLLPKIVDSALVRMPIAGHITHEGLKRIGGLNSRFDMGNFTLTYPVFSTIPFMPTGVPEYLLPSFLRHTDIEETPAIEPPIFHHRQTPAVGKFDSISNVVDQNALFQFSLESIESEALGLSEGRRSFYNIRTSQIKRLRYIRDYLDFRHSELSSSEPEISESMRKLLSLLSEEKLRTIEKDISNSRKHTKYAKDIVKKYVEASKMWPKFVEMSWKLGKSISV